MDFERCWGRVERNPAVEPDVLDRDDDLSRCQERRGLAHRFQAERHRQNGQPVLVGVDAAHRATAERVVVGMMVFADVQRAAEHDLPARFVANDLADETEGRFWGGSREWEWESGAAAKSGRAKRSAGSGSRVLGTEYWVLGPRPVRNACITSRWTSRNCSIVAKYASRARLGKRGLRRGQRTGSRTERSRVLGLSDL